jgi:hypothetical protein
MNKIAYHEMTAQSRDARTQQDCPDQMEIKVTTLAQILMKLNQNFLVFDQAICGISCGI